MSTEPKRVNNINLLKPELKRKVEYILTELKRQGYKPFVIETLRSKARVEWLISTGATAIRNSKHCDGSAVDIGFIDNNGKAIWDNNYAGWDALYYICIDQHLIHGHSWHKLDSPHVELP